MVLLPLPCQLVETVNLHIKNTWIIENLLILVYLQNESLPSNQSTSSMERLNERCLLSSIPKDKRHTLYDVSYFFVLPLDTSLATLSFIFNSLIVAAVLRSPSIHRPSLLFLCSLSMTDVVWAVFSLYKNIQSFVSVETCPKEVKGSGEFFPYFTSAYSTLGNLALISFDRLLALSKPLWYRARVTRAYTIKQILFVWMVSGILAGFRATAISFPSLTLESRLGGLLWFAVCVSTIIFCYISILNTNRRNRVVIAQYNGDIRAILVREKRVAKTVGLILAVLCCTFLPAFTVPVVLNLWGFSDEEITPLRLFYLLFVTLNGLMNPILNYSRNQEVRLAVRKIIRCQLFNHIEENGRLRIHLNTLVLRVNNRVEVLPSNSLNMSVTNSS